MPIIIDGKKTANEIKIELTQEVNQLKEKDITPQLALLLVGNDPASEIYVSNKHKFCNDIGVASIIEKLPNNTTEKEILDRISIWNNDKNIDGILVQLPLPKNINETKILLSINPNKDVDGFHPENIGKLVAGLPGYIPCTPLGIYELLKRYNIDTSAKHIVVLGRSNIVGKPIANLLVQKTKYANAIVTLCHSAAKNITDFTLSADIIIAAMGVPELIKKQHIKDGAVIIDVGINSIADATKQKGYRLVGDVDYNDVLDKVSAITPVPGGVGPMTIAMLLKNTIQSAKNKM
ncbi:MAG: bifunctional methylenetetrahydrofolate dehydrogenase/methenyltetrahydrofolate cyclohydrolase FolD [Bacteroidetes bacterium]|nr:bifunctional methylenetetrahydrofolate dehydrogenase/methenyltetrahydrofolate cyclohydrolase FolD [Bacteroidota bacterium]